MAELYRFAAFISYSSRDAAFARRLHKALEEYRIPKSLGAFDLLGEGGKGNRIYPVFRDREELSAGDLGERIEAALRASSALIVVCTPDSAASPWVQKEIEYYSALGRRQRIFTVIPDAASSIAADDDPRTCFPPALRGGSEPLAADARKGRDGFRGALLKIVAGLIDVNAGALADRDRSRALVRSAQTIAVSAGAIALLGVVGTSIASGQLRERSNTLAELSKAASDAQDYERAARYALAGLEGSELPLIGFDSAAAEAALRRAAAFSTGVTVLRGHSRDVRSVEFAADGTRVVTTSRDGTAKLWDAAAGTEIASMRGSEGHVRVARFSPDDRVIATLATNDGRVNLWDAHSGGLIGSVGRPDGGHVYSLAFSPDGQELATYVSEGDTDVVRIWNVASRSERFTIRDAGLFAFSPNGHYFATLGARGATIWDRQSYTPLVELSGLENIGGPIVFSPDSTHLITSSQMSVPHIWSVSTGTISRVLEGELNGEPFLYSPDGGRIATNANLVQDAGIRLWNAQTGAMIAILREHEGDINSAEFSADGSLLVTGSSDGTARVWNGRSGAVVSVLRGHEGIVWSVALSRDGSKIASASEDGTVRIWNTIYDTAPRSLPGRWPGHDGAVGFSPDETRLVTLVEGGLHLWDASVGRRIAVMRAPASGAVFSPDGSVIASALFDPSAHQEDDSIRLWDGRTGAPLGRLRGHAGGVRDVSFSADGLTVAAASADGVVRVWDIQSRREQMTLTGHRDGVSTIAFSRDGWRALSQGLDGTARLWDARSGAAIAQLPSEEAAAISSDGELVATASREDVGRVVLSSGETGTEIRSIKGHAERVSFLRFSMDGRRLVVGFSDGTIELWDTRNWAIRATQRIGGGYVEQVAFSNDSRMFATPIRDGAANVWDSESGELLAALPYRGIGGPGINLDADATSRGVAVAFSPSGNQVAAAAFGGTQTWTLHPALRESRRQLRERVCATMLAGEAAAFRPAEYTAAPVLNSRVDRDVCHPPTLATRLLRTLIPVG